VAASAHDVGHPGTTNSFEVRHKSAIAIQYHNRSVLENFHASLTFQTMLRTPGNLLDELGSEDATRFYSLVVNIILEERREISHIMLIKLNIICASLIGKDGICFMIMFVCVIIYSILSLSFLFFYFQYVDFYLYLHIFTYT
jgi:hypothetical protein